MSRIGKNIIIIPAKTEVTVNGNTVSVKGPLGELSRTFKPGIKVQVADGKVSFVPAKEKIDVSTKSLWGTVSSHVKNMVDGVNKAYEKKLILEGIGFKADVVGSDIVLKLGFSHPVKVAIPQNIKVTAEKNVITVSGIDKDFLGLYVAELRALKKPEPYKGKGMRYDTEVIRRKEGKKTV
jgi:large subunit ribosomal protein L6